MGELVKRHSVKGGIAAFFFAMLVSLLLVPAGAGVASAETYVTPSVKLTPSATQVEKAGTFSVDVILVGQAGKTAPASAQVELSLSNGATVKTVNSSLQNHGSGYNELVGAWEITYISDSNLKYDSAGNLKIATLVCKAPVTKCVFTVNPVNAVGSMPGSKTDVKFNVGAPASITVISPDKVTINKTMTAYTVSTNGTKKEDAFVSGAANKARECGNAGYCQLVSPSDGSAATAFPKVGALEAFTLGCSNGYKLSAFNVTYTDDSGNLKKLTVQNGGLTRLGAFNPAKTTYEFKVPDAGDVTVNAVWERTVATIDKVLTSPSGTTSASTCEAGTCMMVATQSGIQATKYPLVGNDTAFKITTKAGYKLSAFNVTYTDEDGNLVKLTNGKGLTRVGAYKASENTYEFTVPNAPDVCVNVTWVK